MYLLMLHEISFGELTGIKEYQKELKNSIEDCKKNISQLWQRYESQAQETNLKSFEIMTIDINRILDSDINQAGQIYVQSQQDYTKNYRISYQNIEFHQKLNANADKMRVLCDIINWIIHNKNNFQIVLTLFFFYHYEKIQNKEITINIFTSQHFIDYLDEAIIQVKNFNKFFSYSSILQEKQFEHQITFNQKMNVNFELIQNQMDDFNYLYMQVLSGQNLQDKNLNQLQHYINSNYQLTAFFQGSQCGEFILGVENLEYDWTDENSNLYLVFNNYYSQILFTTQYKELIHRNQIQVLFYYFCLFLKLNFENNMYNKGFSISINDDLLRQFHIFIENYKIVSSNIDENPQKFAQEYFQQQQQSLNYNESQSQFLMKSQRNQLNQSNNVSQINLQEYQPLYANFKNLDNQIILSDIQYVQEFQIKNNQQKLEYPQDQIQNQEQIQIAIQEYIDSANYHKQKGSELEEQLSRQEQKFNNTITELQQTNQKLNKDMDDYKAQIESLQFLLNQPQYQQEQKDPNQMKDLFNNDDMMVNYQAEVDKAQEAARQKNQELIDLKEEFQATLVDKEEEISRLKQLEINRKDELKRISNENNSNKIQFENLIKQKDISLELIKTRLKQYQDESEQKYAIITQDYKNLQEQNYIINNNCKQLMSYHEINNYIKPLKQQVIQFKQDLDYFLQDPIIQNKIPHIQFEEKDENLNEIQIEKEEHKIEEIKHMENEIKQISFSMNQINKNNTILREAIQEISNQKVNQCKIQQDIDLNIIASQKKVDSLQEQLRTIQQNLFIQEEQKIEKQQQLQNLEFQIAGKIELLNQYTNQVEQQIEVLDNKNEEFKLKQQQIQEFEQKQELFDQENKNYQEKQQQMQNLEQQTIQKIELLNQYTLQVDQQIEVLNQNNNELNLKQQQIQEFEQRQQLFNQGNKNYLEKQQQLQNLESQIVQKEEQLNQYKQQVEQQIDVLDSKTNELNLRQQQIQEMEQRQQLSNQENLNQLEEIQQQHVNKINLYNQQCQEVQNNLSQISENITQITTERDIINLQIKNLLQEFQKSSEETKSKYDELQQLTNQLEETKQQLRYLNNEIEQKQIKEEEQLIKESELQKQNEQLEKKISILQTTLNQLQYQNQQNEQLNLSPQKNQLDQKINLIQNDSNQRREDSVEIFNPQPEIELTSLNSQIIQHDNSEIKTAKQDSKIDSYFNTQILNTDNIFESKIDEKPLVEQQLKNNQMEEEEETKIEFSKETKIEYFDENQQELNPNYINQNNLNEKQFKNCQHNQSMDIENNTVEQIKQINSGLSKNEVSFQSKLNHSLSLQQDSQPSLSQFNTETMIKRDQKRNNTYSFITINEDFENKKCENFEFYIFLSIMNNNEAHKKMLQQFEEKHKCRILIDIENTQLENELVSFNEKSHFETIIVINRNNNAFVQIQQSRSFLYFSSKKLYSQSNLSISLQVQNNQFGQIISNHTGEIEKKIKLKNNQIQDYEIEQLLFEYMIQTKKFDLFQFICKQDIQKKMEQGCFSQLLSSFKEQINKRILIIITTSSFYTLFRYFNKNQMGDVQLIQEIQISTTSFCKKVLLQQAEKEKIYHPILSPTQNLIQLNVSGLNRDKFASLFLVTYIPQLVQEQKSNDEIKNIVLNTNEYHNFIQNINFI